MGIKAPGSIAAIRHNAMKHGAYSEEVAALRRLLAECRARLKEVGETE